MQSTDRAGGAGVECIPLAHVLFLMERIKRKHMCGLAGSVASRVVHWVSHDKQVTVGCLLVHGCFDEIGASCA